MARRRIQWHAYVVTLLGCVQPLAGSAYEAALALGSSHTLPTARCCQEALRRQEKARGWDRLGAQGPVATTAWVAQGLLLLLLPATARAITLPVVIARQDRWVTLTCLAHTHLAPRRQEVEEEARQDRLEVSPPCNLQARVLEALVFGIPSFRMQITGNAKTPAQGAGFLAQQLPHFRYQHRHVSPSRSGAARGCQGAQVTTAAPTRLPHTHLAPRPGQAAHLTRRATAQITCRHLRQHRIRRPQALPSTR